MGIRKSKSLEGTKVIKADLVRAVREQEQISEKQAANIVDLIFYEMREHLGKRRTIEIRGFGTFYMKICRPRSYTSPLLRGNVHRGERMKAAFKEGKELRKLVRGENKDE